MFVGPWTHTNFTGDSPNINFGIAAASGVMNGLGDLSRLHIDWFDAVLKNRPEHLRRVPSVLLYVMGENQWRGCQELPSPAGERSWYFGCDGLRSPESGANGIAIHVRTALLSEDGGARVTG
ncbi:hypothetical protein GCM10023063_10130 [Arthrobacter methylotrophus]|uniref:Uncharacterized protein n=1 Tax=Arthrobacter methylotrophus TaxID=121291 RepID=A0ABV5US65_9MICC